MWRKRMGAFLRGKGHILWDVTVDTGYVQPMDFLAPGSRDRFDANNKVVDYLFRALCQPEFDRVHTEDLACRIWTVLKEAHVGNAQVQARMYATYWRRDTIKKELAKLLAAGFIKEVFHPQWLANPVLVRKKNSNEWRMCVDHTDLNKHCPKDPFGLPRIDQVIDSTAGCDLLCFLDCYSGYHQIAIKEEDQEKTAFITPFGVYCYPTMSFGLKNAGATYQQAIQACFKRQLNKNVEACMDDVVVKTRNSSTLIDDL
jgi:hypothetical protein